MLIHTMVTSDQFSKKFNEEERELLAEVTNRLLDKFENVALIVAHYVKKGETTAPVTASFYGSNQFKQNVAIKMYEDDNLNPKGGGIVNRERIQQLQDAADAVPDWPGSASGMINLLIVMGLIRELCSALLDDGLPEFEIKEIERHFTKKKGGK